MSSEPDKKLHASLPYEVAARSREAERQRHDTVAVTSSAAKRVALFNSWTMGNSLMGLDDHRSPALERSKECCGMLKHAEAYYLIAGTTKNSGRTRFSKNANVM